MKFLVLGANGMAGHTTAIYLNEQGHDITAFARQEFKYCKSIVGDANDTKLLKKVILDGQYDIIVNCIGILNQSAENDKKTAVFLNSYLPHFITETIKDMPTRLIHMSTDCVFSGEKGSYLEDSLPDGATFYDKSKALGEVIDNKNLTFRNSIIGPDINKNGIGLFNWFMKQHTGIQGYTKAIWTGVTTLTLAKAIEKAAEDRLVGLYHLVNNQTISKYELLMLLNKCFKDNCMSIEKNDIVNIDKSLVNTRNDFDFIVPSYEEMTCEMNAWIKVHKSLYPHYFQ